MTAGMVTDLADLEAFLRGRLRTAGWSRPALAAAACADVPGRGAGRVGRASGSTTGLSSTPRPTRGPRPPHSGRPRGGRAARCCARRGSPGRTRRAGEPRWRRGLAPAAPHHAVVLGRRPRGGRLPAARGRADRGLPGGRPGRPARRSGCSPSTRCGPPGCSPGSAGEIDRGRRGRRAADADGAARRPALPRPRRPLDLLAEAHVRAEVRLFAS